MFAHLKELSQKIAKNNKLVMLAHEKERLSREIEKHNNGKSLNATEDNMDKVADVLTGVSILGSATLVIASPIIAAPALMIAAGTGVVALALKAGAKFSPKRTITDVQNDLEWNEYREKNIDSSISSPHHIDHLSDYVEATGVMLEEKRKEIWARTQDMFEKTKNELNINYELTKDTTKYVSQLAVNKVKDGANNLKETVIEKKNDLSLGAVSMFSALKGKIKSLSSISSMVVTSAIAKAQESAKLTSQFAADKVKGGANFVFSALKEKIKSLVGLSSMAATSVVSKADHVLASAGDKIDSLSKTKDAMAEKLSLFVQNAQKDTAFFTASNRGDIKTMSEMVRDGYDVERRGNAALRAAVVSNNVDAVGFLLREGANYRAEVDGKMLLTKAISNGSPEITSMLMDAGATLGVKNQQEINSMMFESAQKGDMKVVAAYVVAGANPKSVIGAIPEYERESLNKIITDYDNSKGSQPAEVNTAQKADDVAGKDDSNEDVQDTRKSASVLRMR